MACGHGVWFGGGLERSKQCMRDEVKKSYFGDPSWKMHFDNPHEMQVFKALCVEKRATPSRGPSLVFR